MSRLIPTPTVDKNGRLTTVHKKADGASAGSSSLAGVRPSLGGPVRQESNVYRIKPKKLKEESPAVRIAMRMGRLHRKEDVEAFMNNEGHMMREPGTISDSDAYDYLRKGISAHDAVALHSLGIGLRGIRQAEANAPYEDYSHVSPGALNKVHGRNHTIYTTETSNVVDRLQESGVSAIVANKLISNGLQDGHLDRALDDDQLIELFSKWRYRFVPDLHSYGKVEQDDVIEGFVSGHLPFELSQNKVTDLKNIESELRTIQNLNPDGELGTAFQDREYLIKLANKVATSMNEYKPLEKIHALVKEHGMGVLDLDDPRRADIKIYAEQGGSFKYAGIEGAKHIESVHRIAEDTIDDTYLMSGNKFDSHGGIRSDGAYLRNWELLKLHKAGLTPEETFEALVLHKLSVDQIMVARQDGVGTTLAEGAL